MVILFFIHGDYKDAVLCFENLENGREFVQKIPGYKICETCIEGEKHKTEFFNSASIPAYFEIKYKNIVFPMTRFSFGVNEKVEIIWQDITNADLPASKPKIADGATKVDAYFFENHELEIYIKKREKLAFALMELLRKHGFTAKREFYGSEDGEALTYTDNNGDWHLLTHLDPSFVFSASLSKDWLEQFINDSLH